jgi:hypothetical protein
MRVRIFTTVLLVNSGDKIYWQNRCTPKCIIDAIQKIKVSPVCPIIALAGFFTTTQKILYYYI